MTIILENVVTVDGLPNDKLINRASYGARDAYLRISGNRTICDMGFLSGIIGQCNYSPFTDDRRACPDFRPGPLADVLIDDNQENALAGVFHVDESTVCMLPGQGHIVVGLEALRRRRTTALILTDTPERAAAWDKTLDDLLQLSDGEHVRVFDRQSFLDALTEWQSSSDEPMWKIAPHLEPGLLIADQVDDWPVEELRRAGRAFRPRYRLAFTDLCTTDADAMLRRHIMGPMVFDGAHANGWMVPSQFNWRQAA